MGTLILILVILFATLFVLLPLLEKYGKERTPEELHKIGRFITPLIFILILLTGFRAFMG